MEKIVKRHNSRRKIWGLLISLTLILGVCVAPAPRATAAEAAEAPEAAEATAENAATQMDTDSISDFPEPDDTSPLSVITTQDARDNASAKKHPVLQLRFDRRVIRLKPGESTTVKMTIIPYNATYDSIDWEADESVVKISNTINANDNVTITFTGVNSGRTTATAKVGDKKLGLFVWVDYPNPTSTVTIEQDKITVSPWDVHTIRYSYTKPTIEGYTGPDITEWSLSGATTVDQPTSEQAISFGAMEPGQMTYVIDNGDSMATLEVTINPFPYIRKLGIIRNGMRYDNDDGSLVKGMNKILTWDMNVGDTIEIPATTVEVDGPFEWSSSNEDIATVIPALVASGDWGYGDSAGCFVTAYMTGSVTLTMSAPGENGTTVTHHAYINVSDPADTSTPTPSTSDATETEVHRLYNPNTGEHLFTADSNEATYLSTIGWDLEKGKGWMAPTSGKGVYRLNNPNAAGGDHLYTTDMNEYGYLIMAGWKADNGGQPLFYSVDESKSKNSWNKPSSVSVYRLYNPNDPLGRHHYTLDSDEYTGLQKLGWKGEGVKFAASSAVA